MNESDLFSTARTADALAEAVPDRTPAEWHQWLINNRNPGRRASYRIPHSRLAGRVYYTRQAIADFTTFEQQRRFGTFEMSPRVAEVIEALGFREGNIDTAGRPFHLSALKHQVDGAGRHFAQLLLADPLRIYRVEPTTCAELHHELTEVLQRLARFGALPSASTSRTP